MKPIDELTDQELTALSDEQIAYYIDRACAEDGIALLPPSPPVEPKDSHAPDIDVFVVPALVFMSRSDADRVAQTASECNRADLSYIGNSYRLGQYAKADHEPVRVSSSRVFSEGLAARTTDIRTAFDKAKVVYEKDRKGYDAILKGRGNVADGVWSQIIEAREREHERADLRAKFERYIVLANGEREVAARFLAKAHHNAPEIVPDLFVGVTLNPSDIAPAQAAETVDDIAF